MNVSSPIRTLALKRIEMPKDLPQAVGHRTVHQIHEMKAAVQIGAPNVRTQLLRLGEGLRPFGVVHKNLAPRRREKYRRCIAARGRSPGIRGAIPAAAQVADQVGQSAIEKTPPMSCAVGELGPHSLAAFLR